MQMMDGIAISSYAHLSIAHFPHNQAVKLFF